MSGSEPVPPTRDQLLEEAATWFARMRGPNAEASRDEFEAWLRRGALHRQAYNRASEIFAMGKVLADDEPDGGADTGSKASRTSRIRRVLVVAGLLIVLGAAGLFAIGRFTPWGDEGPPLASGDRGLPPPEIIRTTSAARTVRLADGSLVTLQADSQLEVRLWPSERRLNLRTGRARFEVFHEVRPFIVNAGGGSVVAHGTIFDVGFEHDRRVTVRLIEGSIEVTYPARRQIRRLGPGQALSYDIEPREAGAAAAPSPVRIEDMASGMDTASPSVVREFDRVTLAALVAAANRGASRPIRLLGDTVAGLQVSGRFRTDDTARLAERLALVFDLLVEYRPDSIVLRSR